MKNGIVGLAALAACVALVAPARAQEERQERPLSVEVRAGAAVPIRGFQKAYPDVDIGNGYTAGASLTYHLVPPFWFFAGYSYNRFQVTEGTHPAAYHGEDAAVDQGFDAGVRLKLFSIARVVEPYVKFGTIYHRFSFEGTEAEPEFDPVPPLPESDYSLSVLGSVGAEVRVTPRVSLSPEVTLTSYAPGFGNRSNDYLQVEHLRGDLGVRFRL